MSEPDERAVFGALDGRPDPEFTQELLDLLLHEIATSSSHPSNETDGAPGEATTGPTEQPPTELEIVMLKPNPQPNRPIGTWVLSTAAALIVIVGAVVLLTRSDDAPVTVVTDDPEPAETVTDEAEPDAVEVEVEPEPDIIEVEPEPAPQTPVFDIGDDERRLVEAFVANVNAGDADAVVSMLGADAEFGSPLIDMQRSALPVDELGDRVGALFALLGDLNAQISIDSCAGGSQIECYGEYTDDVVARVSGVPGGVVGCSGCSLNLILATDGPDTFSLLRVIVGPDEGVIGGYTRSIGGCINPCRRTPWVVSAGYLEFLVWIDATYPDERALLMDDTVAYPIFAPGTDVHETLVVGAFPRFTPEANALWVVRVAEWIATDDN